MTSRVLFLFLWKTARVAIETAIASAHHSDIRASKSHNRDPSGAVRFENPRHSTSEDSALHEPLGRCAGCLLKSFLPKKQLTSCRRPFPLALRGLYLCANGPDKTQQLASDGVYHLPLVLASCRQLPISAHAADAALPAICWRHRQRIAFL